MSNNTVVPIHGADWPVEQILDAAKDEDFESVVVVGWRKEGTSPRFWLSSSLSSEAKVIYALQHANRLLLELTR